MTYTLESLPFCNSFARLPRTFYSPQAPTPLRDSPHLVSFNAEAAKLLDLDPAQAQRPEFLAYLNGSQPWPGTEPLSMLYAGHQFGHYVPQLGDGRAIVMGEVHNQRGERWELQLKGSGITPYSRDGDGRAVLRSTVREYLCSEAMHGLGIPTTRALCILGSDEEVYRERIETGALLLRLAPSHVRFGSFEVFFYRSQIEPIGTLADYIIEHHFPHLRGEDDQYDRLFAEVAQRTAQLIAAWQAVGFAHGVLNTDNMSILGLTLDYGPFGFMERFNRGYICNHSDHHGRYAFDQQPYIGLWNLSCLGQALIPLLNEDKTRQSLRDYETWFVDAYFAKMAAKLGLREVDDGSIELISELLTLMEGSQMDYTRTLRALCDFDTRDETNNRGLRDLFIDREGFDQWAKRYSERLAAEGSVDSERRSAMHQHNPKYILRNYLAQVAIEKATREKDYSEIDRLLELLRDPFSERPEYEDYAQAPPEWADRIEVSCSS